MAVNYFFYYNFISYDSLLDLCFNRKLVKISVNRITWYLILNIGYILKYRINRH